MDARKISWSLDKKVGFFNSREDLDSDMIFVDSPMLINKLKLLQSGFIGNNLVGVNGSGQIFTYTKMGIAKRINAVECKGESIKLNDFIQHSFWVACSGKIFAVFRKCFYEMTLSQGNLALKLIRTGLPDIEDVSNAVYNEASDLLVIGTSHCKNHTSSGPCSREMAK